MIEWLMIWYTGHSNVGLDAMDYGIRHMNYDVFPSSTALIEKYESLDVGNRDSVRIYQITEEYKIKPIQVEKFRLEKKR